MQILPANNYILVEVDEEVEKTSTGLLVPTVKGERTEAYAIRAIVVEIGEYAKNLKILDDVIRMRIKVGDKVLVAKWEGQNVSANGKKYILIKAEHIMAFIK